MNLDFFYNIIILKKYAWLDFFYIGSLGAFASLCDFKTYLLAFIKSLESIALNCAEVYEYVVTFIGGDKSVALCCVEPFYCAVASQSVASQQEIYSSALR